MSDTNKPTETSIVKIHGWDLVVDGDQGPRVRDIDLGARLGFARPIDFRKLVRRMVLAGKFIGSEVVATVARTSSRGGRPGVEYLLSKKAAYLAISKSETALADTITRQMIDVFDAYTEGRLTPSAPALSAVPLSEVHGSRVGETTVRGELVAWCRLAARSLGVTIHRVHGAIRRQYKVASAYHLSLNVWPMVRSFLEALATQRLFLDAPTRPALRLIAGGAQTSMPWAVEVANR